MKISLKAKLVVVRVVLAALLLLFWDYALGLYIHRHSPSLCRPHPILTWRLRSRLNDFWDGKASITTNSRGLRGPEVPLGKGAEEVRVLVMGDSSSFGDGVTYGETYGARLEALLNALFPKTRWSVVNGAMKGYSTFQGRYLLERVGLSYHPDLVVFAFLHSDFKTDAREDRLTNLNPPVVKALQELLYESNLYLLLRQGLLNRSGAAAQGEAAQVHRVSAADFRTNLEEMARLCTSRGMGLIFLNMPREKRNRPGEDEPWRDALKAVAKESGAPVVDLFTVFREREAAGDVLCFDTVHPNGAGHALIAESLLEALLRSAMAVRKGGSAR